MPVPPQLAGLLERYIQDRRPAGCQPTQWARRDELLLRRRPGPAYPDGAPTGRRRIEELFARLARSAPDLFAAGDLSLHSYRHALGTHVDGRWGRAVTRAVLGHTSRRSPTDYYVHVDPATVAEVLTAYERHLLAGNDHATGRRGPTTSQ
jgi:integrase